VQVTYLMRDAETLDQLQTARRGALEAHDEMVAAAAAAAIAA
jgi:hypothetical protein